ncbi:hypothetical protein C7413_12169 [Paraburkholderia silvatlantica]|nr:hypothetical protein C7411_12269 [Paraburkholderia silvatlantica]PXW33082.1 hypothetical protein C7413_12169 [Paraburkholderia silvatlantica]
MKRGVRALNIGRKSIARDVQRCAPGFLKQFRPEKAFIYRAADDRFVWYRNGSKVVFVPGKQPQEIVRIREAKVAGIKAPTLIVAGRRDTVTPAAAAWRAATRIPDCEFHLVDGNHFELHLEGEAVCLQNIVLQLAFLRKHLGVDPSPTILQSCMAAPK